MEVADNYKSTLDEILKLIPKHFVDKGPYSKRLYRLISSGLEYYDRTNANNMTLSILTGENMVVKASGEYYSEIIQESIQRNIKKQLHYKYYFSDDRIMEVYFGLMDAGIVNYQKYHDMMRLIISWAHICMKYAFKECSKKHNIFFYLTDFKKEMPNNNIIVLDRHHVNTGVTTRCRENNETIIYRKEEWFKVYVHEMIHAFGFDISETYRNMISKEIKKLFDVKSSMRVEEAYVETWARIINGAYASIQSSENEEDFEQLFLFSMEVERLYAAIKAQQVLNYMHLSYDSVITKGNRVAYALYRERTNVFAYYILVAMFMNDPYDFMRHCNKTNRKWLRFDNTIKAVKELEKYIKALHLNPVFLENIRRNYRSKNRGLRMSLIEVN